MSSMSDRLDRGAPRRAERSTRHLEVVRNASGTGERGGPQRPVAGLVAPGPGRQAPLRLTRRGRVVVRLLVVTLLALVITLAVLLLGRPAEAGTEARPMNLERVVVEPGETLWGIAGRVAPDHDRRETVRRIIELNALPSGVVRAGQEIALPPL